MIVFVELIHVMDVISTKITNTITTNVTEKYHSKKSIKLQRFGHSFIINDITIDNFYYLL